MSESSLANDAAQSVSESMTTTTATVLATAAHSSAAVFSSTIKPNTISNGKDYSSTLSAITETIKSLISSTTTTTTAATTTSSVTTSMPFTTSPIKTTTGSPTFTSTMSAGGFMNAYSSFGSSSGPMDSGPVEATEPALETNRLSVSDLSSSLQHFGLVDYFVFVMMLAVCAVIGFYFGFIEKKKKKKRDIEERRGSEALDYLVGGRKMKVFPVSLSLVASFVSGISLLGTSTEIYVYGTQYAFILITLVISGVISWYVFLPVFCNLQLTSTYEYFEMRFDKAVRLLGSVLFSIGTITWLPIVIYVPALAFNQVTGVNIHIVTPVVCVVCIFYTCVGGLKAVVWTDVVQTVIMLGAIILVIVKGTIDVGGLGVVWQRNWDSGRLEVPEMTWDPTVRISMFSIFVGSTFFYVQCTAGNQVIMQRYLSVPGLKEVKKCLITFIILVVSLMSLTFYNGLLIFATYHDCDPLTTKLAKAKDQLVPLLVMDILRVFPGIPGLFVAGVFSAALSSLSTGLNSLAAVILEDYIKPLRKTPLTDRQTGIIMRTSVVAIGILCVGLVFVVEVMGSHVIQLSITLSSMSCGPLFGMFIMGLLIPHINGKSAFTGCVGACIAMTIICVKGQIAIATGELVFAEKNVSTEGCSYLFEPLTTPANATVIPEPSSKTFAQYLFHMSFLLYTTVGSLLSIIIAGISSIFFGRNKPSEMNIELFSPFIHRLIKPGRYSSVHTDERIFKMKPTDTKESFCT